MSANSSSQFELLLSSNYEIKACKFEIDATNARQAAQVFQLYASPSKFLRLCLPSSHFLIKMFQRELSTLLYLFYKQTEKKNN